MRISRHKLIQTCHDGKVRLEICDSGEGIPPEQLQQIWQRYYRVPGNHRRAAMGSGLGLSIIRGILYASMLNMEKRLAAYDLLV